MKNTLLLIMGFCTTLSYSQTNEVPSNKTKPTTQSNSSIEINSSGNTHSILNQNNANLQPVSAGNHVCKTFELNQQHYQNRGLLIEFNQSSLQGAMNVNPVLLNKTPGSNNISVIFHVVHNPNNPAENVSNALLMQVFNDLTDDYQLLNTDASNARTALGFNPADANINFCLATQDPSGNPLSEVGVIRVATTEDWYDSDNGEQNKMKSSTNGGSQIWNRNNYLNIWICDISNGANSGTAGYAYRPTPTLLPSSSIDGIVLDYNLGVNNNNVLTHEVGHYLGLDHTWGGSGSCASDDGFTDTPMTQGPSFNFSGSCTGSQQTCTGIETQYENYMDYANCTVMFTQDQANYMLSLLQGIRSSLLLSPGCDPTNTPPISQFTSSPIAPAVIPVNGGVNFIDQSTNVPTGWNWTISGTQGTDWEWINGTNANTQNPHAEFYAVGFYNVTLAASNSYGTDITPSISNNHIEVVAPAVGTACDTLRNWDPVDAAANNFTYYNVSPTNGAWGTIPGHNQMDIYGDGSSLENTLQYAEKFNYSGTAEVRQVQMPFFKVSDNSGTGTIVLKVYADDNTPNPGTVLTTETINIADITLNQWNEFDFTTPASVTGAFWVGFEVFYGNPQDTILIAMTGNTISGGIDGYYMELDTYGWLNSTLLGVTGSMAMDVMLSNGPAPAPTFTTTDGSVCIGGSIDVNGSGSTNVTNYNWYVTDDPYTTTITTSFTPTNTFTFPNTGDFSIYLFSEGSCISNGVVLPITVSPSVTATVSSTNTTCGNNNGTISIADTLGGQGTYYFSLDGTNYTTNNTFNNLAAGNYTVYIRTVGNLCETTYNVTINSSTEFIAGINNNSSICPGESATLTASGGTNYSWLDGSTIIGTTASITIAPPITTQYNCIVTDAVGCQSTVSTTVTIHVPPTPPTITTSGATTICAGTSVDLTSSYPTNNIWSTTETSSIITVSTAAAYTVIYTDGNGCSSTSAPTTVTVNSAPTITAGTVSNPSSCGTSTGAIEVTGPGTGNISWTGTATGSASSINLPYTIPNLVAGAYNITFTDATGCVSNVLPQGLNDPTPPPTPTISLSGSNIFCSGGSVTLTSSYAGGNSWSTSETSDAITVTNTNTLSVTYTNTSGCSSTSLPIVITVNNNPTPPTITASGATTFCDGGAVTLTSSQGTGNSWSSGEVTQNINATTTGSYTVTYIDANGCSATSTTTNVVANPTPTIPTISASGSTTLCEGEVVTLTSSETNGIVWSTNETTPSIDVSTSGSFTVSYTDANGCSSMSVNSDVVSNPLPSVTIGTFSNLCVYNPPITISGGTPTGGTYSGTGVANGDFDPSVAGIGSHTIIYTYSDGNGCSNTANETILVDGCASVEQTFMTGLSIYPNPTSTELFIELEGDFEVTITDSRGRIINRINGSEKVNINTSTYEAGVYLITINNGTSHSTHRVVKK